VSIEARIEVSKLAHELGASDVALTGLEEVAAADLRRLRGVIGDALHDAHRGAFQRAAQASALLPAVLTARLAQSIIGPYLAARIAAELPAERSTKLAGHLDVPFLADVCLSLDPARVADTIAGLPDRQVIDVGLELLERGEYATLGKFVDVVSPAVVDAMADRIQEPVALLRIAIGIEARHRLDEVVTRIDDDRLASLLDAAVEHQEMATAFALLSDLGDDNRRRVAHLAAAADPDVLDAIADAAHAEGAWDRLLPFMVHFTPEQLDVLVAEERLLTPDLVRALFDAALTRPDLWEALVATLGRIPEERQRELAGRVAAADGIDARGLAAVGTIYPPAKDLPVVVELRRLVD
jgi:hypothetical protein